MASAMVIGGDVFGSCLGKIDVIPELKNAGVQLIRG